ncbi:flagellar motor protein MotB [Halarsenatibacter silvermanii]|uniref:Chemotaxis protein MotB n=1 Tax=Halarsenatibacter silvermanii TaxID=321763 RepID=A0A1G9MIP9_9FIRM|nr:flagellar motor protein MotB [Halarsenatibacter silvermanii]SDL73963.1 chemotaxis protein MotB [Halarsenatibacter silvermanii]
MARKGSTNDDDGGGGSPEWMTTFGDMMTLLLTFFVLLYSMSSIDEEQFEIALDSIREGLGVFTGGRTIATQRLLDGGAIGEGFSPMNIRLMETLMGQIEQYVQEEQVDDAVSMEMTERGLEVRFAGDILFDLGDAEIRPEGEEVLREVGEMIEETPNDVVVEGHTDNLPIRTDRFPSNWELSTARATTVARFFIEDMNLDSERFSAAGYSEYRPLVPNDSPENRAQNRRVEVIFLNPDFVRESPVYEPAEEQPDPGAEETDDDMETPPGPEFEDESPAPDFEDVPEAEGF